MELKLTVDDRDVTTALSRHLRTLTLRDGVDGAADTLELQLDPEVSTLRRGAVLRLWLPSQAGMTEMGEFVVGHATRAIGAGAHLKVAATGAPMRSDGAAESIRTPRRASWPSNTTFFDVVASAAARAALRVKVHRDLADIVVGHIEQVDESDASLLDRLARQLGAMVKPVAGVLIATPIASGQSAGGHALGVIRVAPSDITAATCKMDLEHRSTHVLARYHGADGRVHSLDVGDPGEVMRLRHVYADYGTAHRSAQAELQRIQRGARHVSVTMPGRGDARAGVPLSIHGAHPDFDGDLSITSSTHVVTGSTQYTVTLTASDT